MNTLVILTIAWVALLPGVMLALSVCPTPGQCPANAECTGAGAPCECNQGFHENTAGTGCEQDISLGSTCTQQNSDRECVDGATCLNVTSGETQALQCTCKEGYQQRAVVGGVATCKLAPGSNCTTENSTDECVPETTCQQRSRSLEGQVTVQLTCTCSDGQHLAEMNGLMICKDDVKPGGNCTMVGQETECVDNAVCAQEGNTTTCTCNHRFHVSPDSASCQPDVAPNSPCQIKNSMECVENAVCQNTAPIGQPEVLGCVCPDAGFHVVSVGGSPYSCEPDIQPGGNCSMADSATECVESATCVNMTSVGELTCACNVGYHDVTNSTSGDVSCQPDIIVGAACAMNGSDVECVEGATCLPQMTSEVNSTMSLQCSCMDGYHRAIGDPSACEQDKGAGSTCLVKNSSECVQHALCHNVALPGEAEVLQCVCVTGYHRDNLTCMQDVEAGQPCSQENSTEQCVEHATCINDTQSGAGDVTQLKCMCDADYHETHDASNRTVCAEDTCVHTKGKCAAAGMTTCDEVHAFIGCMLTGNCDATDSEQVTQFYDAIMEAQDNVIAGNCSSGGNATCTDKATTCLNAFLKANSTCDLVETLGTCLAEFQTECQEDAGFKLATAFTDHSKDNLSCVCETASSMCLTTQRTNYDATAADNATKCSAVKELFSCALDDVQCDVRKTRDHVILSDLWSTAMTWSSATGCKDSLENADTCPLKLTRCALIYADGLEAAADNKTMKCRSAESFGSCIMDNSTLCNANHTALTLFREQYTLVSGECLCISKVTNCKDDVGILSNDSLEVCPKMETLSSCLLSAKCHLASSDDIASLDGAHDWYTQHRDDGSCKVTSDGTCAQDIAVCADILITQLQGATTAPDQCSAITDSMLCINAANCSDDDEVMTSRREAAKYRLKSLACIEPTCNVTHQALTQCKVAYEDNFTAAGTDSSRKCTAKNDMVRCLRDFKCNTHLTDIVQQKYDALKNVNVSNCELLSLEEKPEGTEETSAAPSLHTPLLALLVCLTVSAAARK